MFEDRSLPIYLTRLCKNVISTVCIGELLGFVTGGSLLGYLLVFYMVRVIAISKIKVCDCSLLGPHRFTIRFSVSFSTLLAMLSYCIHSVIVHWNRIFYVLNKYTSVWKRLSHFSIKAPVLHYLVTSRSQQSY